MCSVRRDQNDFAIEYSNSDTAALEPEGKEWTDDNGMEWNMFILMMLPHIL